MLVFFSCSALPAHALVSTGGCVVQILLLLSSNVQRVSIAKNDDETENETA